MISHGVLDSMTSAGLGVMLFYPWSQERVFSPWRPLPAPPVRLSDLSVERLLSIFKAELPLILGCAAAGMLLRLGFGRLGWTTGRRTLRGRGVTAEGPALADLEEPAEGPAGRCLEGSRGRERG
jgi:hypothetical protein